MHRSMYQRKVDHLVPINLENSQEQKKVHSKSQGWWHWHYWFYVLGLIALFCLGLYLFPKRVHEVEPDTQVPIDPGPPMAYTKNLDFWSVNLKGDLQTTFCENLYNGEDIKMPENFTQRYTDLAKRIGVILKVMKAPKLERSIVDVPSHMRFYSEMASQDFVNIVCEVGFSAGQSTLVYVMANSRVRVFSFDSRQREYTPAMEEWFHEHFEGRIRVYHGDSKDTVPPFSGKCDLISIDGSRTYEGVLTDIGNFRSKANVDRNVVLVNHSPGYESVWKAWRQAVENMWVEPIFQCRTNTVPVRGFSVGRFINLGKSDNTVLDKEY